MLERAIQRISNQVKKVNDLKPEMGIVECNGDYIKTKSYNSNNYETIASIRLSKGKYLLTLSALMQGTINGIYFYEG